ncbi:MAG: peptidyl-prolyl cis-trans isomerase [Nitrospinae bacterium]|nr:peptidyl-prolyl cis-trans isomerase [Nitrospinota bacterium]
MKRYACAALAALLLTPPAAWAETPLVKVYDRVITKEELNRTLGSLPVNDPTAVDDPLGKNPYAREIISRMIDAEILWREAVAQGITKSAAWKEKVDAVERATLAGLYRRALFDAKATVPDARVDAYADASGLEWEAARAVLVAEKRKYVIQQESLALFDAYQVKFSPALAEKEVASLSDRERLVTSTLFTLDYGDIREPFSRFGSSKKDLLEYLVDLTEERLLAARAREVGLAKSPLFIAQSEEVKKSEAVSMMRDILARRFAPTPAKIDAYIERTGYLKQEPRTVSALMIVVPTEAAADGLRARAVAGESFYQLAMDHSVAPFAREKAGRIGAMVIGRTPWSDLDRALLSTKPGEITLPVQGEKGWSLFKVLEITPAEPRDPKEARRIATEVLTEGAVESHLTELRRRADVTFYPTPPNPA